MEQNLISVLLSTFNQGKYLQKSIDGVLNQSYKNFEFIIVNDGSTDRTKHILEKNADKDQRIRVITLKKNKGVLNALNILTKTLKGEFFLSIASDDFICDPNFFKEAIIGLTKNKTAGGFFGKTVVVDGKNKKVLWKMGNSPRQGFISPDESVAAFFTYELFVPGSSAILRWNYAKIAGGFDKRLGAQCDYYLNHVLPMKFGVVFYNKDVCVMRKIKNSFSAACENRKFFNNHALFEKKINTFLKCQRPSNDHWKRWRTSVINSRLNLEVNGFLFEKLGESFQRIHRWEEDALAPFLKEIIRIFIKEGEKFMTQMKSEEKKAYSIFNKIAGRIEDLGLEVLKVPTPKKKLRSFLGRIRSLLKWN